VNQLKITLRGGETNVWRRVPVPADAALRDLHEVIQQAMGWNDPMTCLVTGTGSWFAGPGA
jgi:hypothetical protein